MLLAREVDTTARLTDGRLELGLGTGYVRNEVEDAGLPWESPGARVDRLKSLVDELQRRIGSPTPLFIGGHGERVLRLAATRADTVAFSGLQLVPGSSEGKLRPVSMGEFDERADLVTRSAGEREPERNVLVQWVEITDDAHGSVERLCADKNLDVEPGTWRGISG